MKTFNLVVSYNGNAETWDEIRNDAENEKIKNVFIGTKEFVSVVRCKDCMHWYNDADTGMACEFTNLGQPMDGFCNWWEMRGE